MYSKSMLGLQEARAAADAVLAEAATGGGPVAVAVTDADGALVYFAAMDGVSEVPRRLAPRKARTAALLQGDTTQLAASAWAPGLLAELGDPTLALLAGGAPGRSAAGLLLGGVGVSGRAPAEDQRLADLGAQQLSG
jgi:glc operon protein GlcG